MFSLSFPASFETLYLVCLSAASSKKDFILFYFSINAEPSLMTDNTPLVKILHDTQLSHSLAI